MLVILLNQEKLVISTMMGAQPKHSLSNYFINPGNY